MSREHVIGQVAIERAKCIIAVAREVQDDEARQVLRDAASDAHVPESVAAAQIISELQADRAEVGLETTVEMLERGLTAVRPVEAADPVDHPPDRGRRQAA